MGKEKVALFISAPAQNQNQSEQAIKKTKDLLSSGIDVDHIFFYFNAVLNASPRALFHQQWNQLAHQFNVRLIACSTLAETRNLIQEEAGQFEFAGLSEFYSRLHKCQKVVQL